MLTIEVVSKQNISQKIPDGFNFGVAAISSFFLHPSAYSDTQIYGAYTIS